LVAGSVLAENKFGSLFFVDPKVLLSIIMWLVYMVLLYTRWNSGWRGRKAAYLAAFAFVAAVGAWAANYFSHLHRFNIS
jgi:ABC-type transport system involved in cytochrome c biogenesis permease subunit